MNDVREEFENWGNATFNYGFEPETWDASLGGFHHEGTQMAWEGWQAATKRSHRVPLTDKQLDALAMDENGLPNSHLEFARAIEAATARAQRVPLTPEQIMDLEQQSYVDVQQPVFTTDCWGDEVRTVKSTRGFNFFMLARAVERHHGIVANPGGAESKGEHE